MIKYIFKTTVTGTDNNKLFKRVERIHYSGKCNLSNWGRDFFVEEHMNDSSIKMSLIRMAKEYGYSTKNAAENYLKKMVEFHENEENYGFNTFSTDIIAVEL